MYFDVALIDPAQSKDISTTVIICVSIFIVLTVAVICTILLKKKNAK